MSAAVSRTGRTSGRAAPFRCSDAARERCDALTGTATHVRGWLVLEDPGPWGQNAWRDARLPDGLGATMLRRAQAAGIRALLARRPVGRDGSTVPRRRRVFVAYTRPGSVSMVTTTLSDPAEVLDIDLGALAAGVLPEWTTTTEPFLGVCTHGRHDACCAIRGRPTAHRLAEVEPDCTWEVSHIGGDRFAANLLVLPAGLYFGQLDAESVTGVVVDYRAGVLDLEHFRGRSGWPMVVQVAEAALRPPARHHVAPQRGPWGRPTGHVRVGGPPVGGRGRPGRGAAGAAHVHRSALGVPDHLARLTGHAAPLTQDQATLTIRTSPPREAARLR
jgi:hypothetical protein